MNAPKERMSLDDFHDAFKTHFGVSYKWGGTNYVCKTCNEEILYTTGYMSVHLIELGNKCSGLGKVKRFPLPYCPTCGGEPTKTETCVHVSSEEQDLIEVFAKR